jgi:hypothetical protein
MVQILNKVNMETKVNNSKRIKLLYKIKIQSIYNLKTSQTKLQIIKIMVLQ